MQGCGLFRAARLLRASRCVGKRLSRGEYALAQTALVTLGRDESDQPAKAWCHNDIGPFLLVACWRRNHQKNNDGSVAETV